MKKSPKNIAYVDGQNLYMGTNNREPIWKIDLHKFRIYLKEKYNAVKAYYYLGYVQDGNNFELLYEEIQSAGFILIFREHNSAMKGTKKGNVDADILFSIMKRLCTKEIFDKIILVSGDGDYKTLVDFLIHECKFEKLLFPKQKYASSLYKSITRKYFADLSNPSVMNKIKKK